MSRPDPDGGAARPAAFSPRVEQALAIALQAHGGQVRKGRPSVPYVVHPLHVAHMAARYSDDEDIFVAALLHDVVEDCDGWELADLEQGFGARVAGIVDELTEDKRDPWKVRKDRTIAHVPELSEQAVLIKACDKLHNMRSLVRDLEERDHEAVWSGFSGRREGTLSVARRLADALAERVPADLGRELLGTVARVEALANAV